MGTFSDSKIRVARTAKKCAHCYKVDIAAGERYLDYKLGQRHSLPVAISCARMATWPDSDKPRYACAALTALLGAP